MKWSRIGMAVALALAAVAGAPRASAEEPSPPVSPPTSSPVEEARRHFERALEASRAGDLRSALLSFRAAHELSPATTTLWNILVIEVELGMSLEAHKDIEAYLWLAGEHIRPERLHLALETQRKLERQLSRLRVGVDALGATVQVDGVRVDGWTWLSPGEHVVTVEAPERDPVRRVITLKRGAATEIEISVQKKLGPVALAKPARPVAAAPDMARRTAGYFVAGTSLAALLVGGGFGVSAIVRRNEADAGCGGGFCSEAALAIYEEAQTAAAVANVLFATGTAAAGLGAYLILSSGPFASERPGARGESAAPRVARSRPAGAGAVGIGIGGRF